MRGKKSRKHAVKTDQREGSRVRIEGCRSQGRLEVIGCFVCLFAPRKRFASSNMPECSQRVIGHWEAARHSGKSIRLSLPHNQGDIILKTLWFAIMRSSVK